MMNSIMKAIDVVIFSLMAFFAFDFFSAYIATADITHALKFDAVYIVVLFYIMARRPDVNTVTLSLIILISRLIDMLILNYNIEHLGGFVYYPVVMVLNLIALAAIWTRPVIFSKVWPWKNNPNFGVTRQDDVMAYCLLFKLCLCS